jgi:general secretion pathway protein M
MTPPRFTLPPAVAAWQAPLRARWQALAPRERRMVAAAAAVVAFAVAWMLFVRPAWHTVRETPKEIDALDLQLQQMQGMAAEARELHGVAPMSPDQSGQALQAATQRLGNKARVTMQGDRAVVNLNGVTTRQFSEWLNDVRAGARARPLEVQLSRGPQGYSGTVVVGLGSASS